ncbi:hypothetical protein AD947_10910 [Acetobacter tropicalis]|uniref:DUF937 domain-containing protein n=1 Tax=Acetobacter tropicalis TaxID=104102 RepID=A0A149TTI1_9PROT|nr:YidB family protein [Acetobacter tropicalis]KXV56463.1 hypothetical protein AD947_10910 [Acetobacter tropicalis]
MTASATEQLNSVFTKAADTLTAATTDTSGLFSALVQYLEHNGNSGEHELRQNAQIHGLNEQLAQWDQERRPDATTEDVVTKLLPVHVIEKLAEQSGLSREAAVRALTGVLPAACHKERSDQYTTQTR